MAAARTLALALTSFFTVLAAAQVLPLVPQSSTVPKIEHVLLVSVDGLHQVDVSNFVTKYPNSYMAKLASKGISYPGAKIKGLSDSFPGLLSLLTGATSGTTGVWYDDSYATNLFAPTDPTCKQPGTEILFDKSIEKDDTTLFSGINPAALPHINITGACLPLYPHSFVKVNTIFEVIKAAGKRTMWSDKAWAYDLVNGPSGKGVDDLFTPEVAAVIPPTDSVQVWVNDVLKVQAVINNIQGRDSNDLKSVDIPAIMGLDFQTLNVAQKAHGYTDAKATPSAEVLEALLNVDASLGALMAALRASGIEDKTAIILTAKHGQSPIDPSTLKKIDGKSVVELIKSKYPGEPAKFTSDTVGIIWLNDKTKAAGIADLLAANKAAIGAKKILSGDDVTSIFTNSAKDPDRTPDVIIDTIPGVIYTTGSKIMESGGMNDDDVKVPILIKAPYLLKPGSSMEDEVTTTQVAPTILSLLGLEPSKLKGVEAEGTKVLPGLSFETTKKSDLVGSITGVLPFAEEGPAAAPAPAPMPAKSGATSMPRTLPSMPRAFPKLQYGAPPMRSG